MEYNKEIMTDYKITTPFFTIKHTEKNEINMTEE